MKGGLDTLVLRLTNRCNLACGYCYAGSGPAGEDQFISSFLEISCISMRE